VYTFCLLFSYLIKVVALLIFICCYQHVLVNKDIHNYDRIGEVAIYCVFSSLALACHEGLANRTADCRVNIGDDNSTSDTNSMIFGPVTPEFPSIDCVTLGANREKRLNKPINIR